MLVRWEMSKHTSLPWKRIGLEIRGSNNELIAIVQTFGSYVTAVANADHIVNLANKENEKENCVKKHRK